MVTTEYLHQVKHSGEINVRQLSKINIVTLCLGLEL